MRTQTIPILLAALLIAAGVSLVPIALGTGPSSLALQGQGEDHDRGHGNDEDGDDSDNPGQGNDRDQPGVVVTGTYTVEVDCDFDDDDNVTECDISADDARDAPDIGRVIIPEEAVCAEVLAGKFVYLGPDAGANVTGYASEEGDDDLALEMRGRVTTSGTITYWISTIDGVFPAEGPGFQCDQASTDTTAPTAPSTATEESPAAQPSPTPTEPPSTPAPTTGSLAVVTYTCTDVPEDRTGYEWFGMCQRGAGAMTFSLTPPGGTEKDALTMESENGAVTFEQLEPGEYQLDAVDASWCHATSDNVTAESGLVVDAGKTTTVWLFMCDGPSGGV